MEEKKNNTGGKRVEKRGRRAVVPIVICACLVLALAGGYAALCNWADNRVLPNSRVQGLYLEGLEREQAADRLEEVASRGDKITIDLIYDNTLVVFEAAKADPALDIDSMLDEVTVNEPFLRRGMVWLKAQLSRQGKVVERELQFANPTYIDGLCTELHSLLSHPVEQHSITVEEGVITVERGWSGQAIHTDKLAEILLERVVAGDSAPLMLEATMTPPNPPDFQSVYDAVYVEPVNSALDLETLTITPHVTGVSFDMDAVRAEFDNTRSGGSFQWALTYTEPEITQPILTERLFAHKLGEAYSWVTGSNDRLSNVTLAGSFCHEEILLPGDTFSYWDHIAPCTKEQGFKDAPTYLNGQTVPGVGGGICQVSSTIYTAVLQANLEIVQRNPHSYIPGYLPNGSDAMVNGGSSDFKFRNNTDYPIQIRVEQDGRNLTISIWGTKLDDTYVVMEHNDISSTPYTTKYKIDPKVPVGKTREDVTPYTGYKTESYRCIYAGDGTLISRTKESVSNYRKRDRVIAINPADAAKYNVDPVTGEKLPEPKPTPTPAPAPTPTPKPEAAP